MARGDGDTLALSSGELRRHVMLSMTQPYLLQNRLGHQVTILGGDIAIKQRNFDIIDDVERLYQMETLKMKPISRLRKAAMSGRSCLR